MSRANDVTRTIIITYLRIFVSCRSSDAVLHYNTHTNSATIGKIKTFQPSISAEFETIETIKIPFQLFGYHINYINY